MIIFGKNAITEALRANKAVFKLYIQSSLSNKCGEVLALAKRANIKVNFVDKLDLDKLVNDTHHQGFVAEVEDFRYSTVDEIIQFATSRGEQPFIVILDGVEDPHNLGSILRVCECAGVHGVIIPKHRACPINHTVAKTSAGALNYMRVAKVTNLTQTIEKLKEENIWVYAVELGGNDIYSTNLRGGLALVIGSEGDGISPLVKRTCDAIVTMPMAGKVNSLNASVACGVAVFEAMRQRRE